MNNNCSLIIWWLWRRCHSLFHSELGRETLQRRWYLILRSGRVGRCQIFKGQLIIRTYFLWFSPIWDRGFFVFIKISTKLTLLSINYWIEIIYFCGVVLYLPYNRHLIYNLLFLYNIRNNYNHKRIIQLFLLPDMDKNIIRNYYI